MAAPTGKEQNINQAVALKATVDLFVAGILEFEGDDIAAELFAIADPIAAGLNSRTTTEKKSGGRKSSGGSKRRGSSSRKSTGGRSRKPSGKQLAYATDLIEGKDQDEYAVEDLDDMTAKEVSDLIEELKEYDDLDYDDDDE